ncbi:polysaccharide deacetylase [Siculibacillus lacustris]|uniref:Chitooligosaccharide deacetylase n=1 Tax=Siculibacillus lacustris TaxID=1549641 RepID=A0A4Q9VUB1_9HYPH|nr:polysaccharide deacetylase family protein [Siculibacillus lacustris]TBW38723.1 polysaccharide deacetylase [Siculibacillus lacustris]
MFRPLAPAALLLALLTGSAAATEAPPGPLCPAPGTAAEKAIAKHVAAAHVAVPPFADLPTAPALAPERRGSIRRVELPAGEKLVALTFDLCETENEVAGYDGEIVDELRRRHVATTFFVGGHWAATHPRRFAELAADPLFEIGNHTWTHANLRTVDDGELARQILAPEAAFRAALAGGPQCPGISPAAAKRSTLFRFPFGACDARSLGAVAGAGMAAIQWDVSTGDPSPLTGAADIVADTLRGVRPGSIVLAHANGRGFHTGAALPRLIDALTARGYRFVTVGELLARGRPVITDTCFDAHPGDTDRHDRWSAGRRPSRPPLPVAAVGLRGADAPPIAPPARRTAEPTP